MSASGSLEITLLHGEDLKDVDKWGEQDPYVIIRVGAQSARSHTHTDGGKNPVWNQLFTFPAVTSDQSLRVEVFDENLVLRDVAIGSGKMALKDFIARGGSTDFRLPLTCKKGKPVGEIVLRLSYKKMVTPSAVGVVSLTPSASQNKNGGVSPRPPTHVVRPRTGYRPGMTILPTYANTDCWAHYMPGTVLGKGTYGTTYKCVHKATGKAAAVKVIAKRRLGTPEEVEDVQREVQIMHHLAGHPNVVKLAGVYEDDTNVCIAMELCAGGELFDAIVSRGSFSEKDAATLMRTILTVVAHIHAFGVIHRDLKPENFLFTERGPGAALKTTDFGLSTFFQEGTLQTDIVGSAFYVAPEVLKRSYGKEADVWSCGVILYIMLCGTPPFSGDKESKVFSEIASKPLDLSAHPWPSISTAAKECVRSMLTRDPRKRATAADMLKHEWLREEGVASAQPLQLEVLTRIKQFAGMNKLKKEALRVIAVALPIDELAGLKEMFVEIDKDKSGTITVDEFTAAVKRKGQAVSAVDMARLMAAADLNGDGIIDYDEFLAAMVTASKLDREETMKKAFEHFDRDGNGHISREELTQALQDMNLSASQIKQIITEVDRDGDGEIDYNEFCVMMRNM